MINLNRKEKKRKRRVNPCLTPCMSDTTKALHVDRQGEAAVMNVQHGHAFANGIAFLGSTHPVLNKTSAKLEYSPNPSLTPTLTLTLAMG
jgi:hypothetical protein